jgi:hypothetical protein
MVQKNDTVNKVKATAFNWVSMTLISIVGWLVMDMHADLKSVLQVIPVMQLKIDNLEDKRLVDRLRLHEMLPKGKHEEEISYDSLTQK